MKASDELRELAHELVVACGDGLIQNVTYNSQMEAAARVKAKGRLLIHKLGPFGEVWSRTIDLNAVPDDYLRIMSGTAKEILDSITKNRLSTIQEMVTAEVLGDLLEHAKVLIEKHFSLAAAVVLRAVLEERLRKLCEARALPLTAPKPTMEHFKQALVQASVIDKIVAKQIDWMAGVGNAAAHALPEFKPEDVPNQYRMMLDFLAKFSP